MITKNFVKIKGKLINCLNITGAEYQIMSFKEKQKLKVSVFKYWRSVGFPYTQLKDEEITEEFIRLRNVNINKMIINNRIKYAVQGLRLANYFHPEMWAVKVGKYRTPLECFHDDEALYECICKAASFWRNRRCFDESCMRMILSIYRNVAKVSNFRPTAAKTIYQLYTSNNDTVLDFSAGYGGRLLGCLCLDRKYIGIEPCTKQVKGLNSMITKLKDLGLIKLKPIIYQAPAEEFLKKLKTESVSLIFSSPPYFNLEKYATEATQSFIKYPSYDLWVKHFLTGVISESFRILKKGKFFIINVANIGSTCLAKDTFRICKNFFKYHRTLKLQVPQRPFKRKNKFMVYKHEPIYVFIKK